MHPRDERQTAPLDGAQARRFHLVPSNNERALPPELRSVRDKLEREIVRLRGRKHELSEQDYYIRLETLLVRLAEL